MKHTENVTYDFKDLQLKNASPTAYCKSLLFVKVGHSSVAILLAINFLDNCIRKQHFLIYK